MTGDQIVRYDDELAEIEQATDLSGLKTTSDRLAALRTYAKSVAASLDEQNRIAELRLRAQRRAGELMLDWDGAQGQRSDLTSRQAVGKLTISELADEVGITTRTSERWRGFARLPIDRFESFLAAAIAAETELTASALGREVQSWRRSERAAGKFEPGEIPAGLYRVWYADPPWQYSDAGVIDERETYGRAERHYPTMSISELCAMGPAIRALSAPDAVLFLWVTSPLLFECAPVIDAWGFGYKASIVWDKVGHNFGHYVSVRHELLLICTRGSCTPDATELVDSVISIERTTHSTKPPAFRELIDRLYLGGDRIELFARAPAPGWAAWGNEGIA